MADPVTMSDEARAYGRLVASKLLNGRKGHGGVNGVVHRQMREADLIALAGLAFDAGRAAK